jgi:gamma-glutamylcyclotransferase
VYYFAYASNLDREQMLKCCPSAQPKCIATLPNHKLIFAGWSRKWRGGVASIKPCRGERVIGAVYEISQACLRLLDEREGYPAVYDRKKVIVFTEFGDPVEAVAYVKAEQSEQTQPSREYLATIQRGYKDWGID